MIHNAGKITIATACSGLLVFALVFFLDLGRDHFQTVSAQTSGTATTSLTVRNLPPIWEVEAFEQTPSATNTPINTGEVVIWEAEATNNLPYWLLICSTNATPTPVAASSVSEVGDQSNAPSCGTGATEWAVSTSTLSGETAIASLTTTNDDTLFDESNEWYAFVCDADMFDPRCSTAVQGDEAATIEEASPFVLNFRPILTAVANDGPVLPDDTITFTSSSTDPNTLRGNDEIVLHVCSTNVFTNAACEAGQTLATSSAVFTEDAEASFEIDIPTVAFTYEAYVFLTDEFDHVAEDSFQSNFDVANATPEVVASSISINGGSDIVLENALATTSGFTLDVTVTSDNSCVAVNSSGVSLGAGSEFADIVTALYPESVGTSTCDGSAGAFDANNCYTSGAASQWDFSCTKDVSSCTDAGLNTTDESVTYNCTFSVWSNASPTDGSNDTEVQLFNQSWFASVSVIDVVGATSTFTEGDTGVDVQSFLAFDLGTAEIPYGTLEPEEDTGNLIATTTILATGNTGINQELAGSSMCPDFDLGTVNDGPGYGCSGDPSDTIPATFQKFGFDNTIAYTSGSATPLEQAVTVTALIQIAKPTTIATATDDDIYWGIAVPEDITLAGAYTGQNAFEVLLSDATTW